MVMKSRRMGLAGRVACSAKCEVYTQFYTKTVVCRWEDITKMDVKKRCVDESSRFGIETSDERF